MAFQSYDDLNDMHLDALREIGNIGSGNAATSISMMLGHTVDIAVPKIRVLDFDEVTESLGGPENLMAGLLLQLSGDVSGMIMFLLHKDFAQIVLNNLLGTDMPVTGEIDEMSASAIQEVGNIMAASYANAIATLTGLNINISVPDLCIDMVGSILSVPAIYFAEVSDKIIFIEDEFGANEETGGSQILLIPEMEGLKKIMESLGLGE